MISQTGRYAIWAVVYLAEHASGGPTTASRVARDVGLPANYLAKILHTLARTGLLDSARGRHGGFQLAQPADQIKLADILSPFEHLPTGDCILTPGSCHQATQCRSRRRCAALSRALTAFLYDTRLADLM